MSEKDDGKFKEKVIMGKDRICQLAAQYPLAPTGADYGVVGSEK